MVIKAYVKPMSRCVSVFLEDFVIMESLRERAAEEIKFMAFAQQFIRALEFLVLS